MTFYRRKAFLWSWLSTVSHSTTQRLINSCKSLIGLSVHGSRFFITTIIKMAICDISLYECIYIYTCPTALKSCRIKCSQVLCMAMYAVNKKVKCLGALYSCPLRKCWDFSHEKWKLGPAGGLDEQMRWAHWATLPFMFVCKRKYTHIIECFVPWVCTESLTALFGLGGVRMMKLRSGNPHSFR